MAFVVAANELACSGLLGDFQSGADASLADSSAGAATDGTSAVDAALLESGSAADVLSGPPGADGASDGARAADAYVAPLDGASPAGDAMLDGLAAGDTTGGAGSGDASPNVEAGPDACVAESDAVICAAQAKNCSGIVAIDRCGISRAIASCGACTSPQTCGSQMANVCGNPVCAPESDASFCARYGKTCGSVTNLDNCAAMRTVATCGSCTGPQTCGASTPNQCGCVSESDASFCARLGHTCGTLAGSDNCGVARTVASCGTCLATNSCSAAGICVCGVYAGCAAGQTCCNSGCFNVGSDPNNCSGCGVSCGPGDAWECFAGQCGCGIRGNGNSCGTSCVNFNTNSNCSHCGDVCDVVGGDVCCTLQGGTVYACRYGGDCAR